MANKLVTLRRRSDFLNIKDNGKKVYVGRWVLINFIENQQKTNRYGWTISTRVGSSVIRNKLKRWCREFIRSKTPQEEKHFDVNIILRVNRNADIKKISYDEFLKNLETGFKQIK